MLLLVSGSVQSRRSLAVSRLPLAPPDGVCVGVLFEVVGYADTLGFQLLAAGGKRQVVERALLGLRIIPALTDTVPRSRSSCRILVVLFRLTTICCWAILCCLTTPCCVGSLYWPDKHRGTVIFCGVQRLTGRAIGDFPCPKSFSVSAYSILSAPYSSHNGNIIHRWSIQINRVCTNYFSLAS